MLKIIVAILLVIGGLSGGLAGTAGIFLPSFLLVLLINHIIPRLRKVIDGEDGGGVTGAVGWPGGGGFRYFRLAPSLRLGYRRVLVAPSLRWSSLPKPSKRFE